MKSLVSSADRGENEANVGPETDMFLMGLYLQRPGERLMGPSRWGGRRGLPVHLWFHPTVTVQVGAWRNPREARGAAIKSSGVARTYGENARKRKIRPHILGQLQRCT